MNTLNKFFAVEFTWRFTYSWNWPCERDTGHWTGGVNRKSFLLLSDSEQIHSIHYPWLPWPCQWVRLGPWSALALGTFSAELWLTLSGSSSPSGLSDMRPYSSTLPTVDGKLSASVAQRKLRINDNTVLSGVLSGHATKNIYYGILTTV